MSALHSSALRDRVELADLIIRSIDSEDRDSVIYTVDDYGMTPLHKARSPAMAQTLLDALTPQTTQQFIKHRDLMGHTAASKALRDGERTLFMDIWKQSDALTQLQLSQGPSGDLGGSLLMWACWSGDRQILRLTLGTIPDVCWAEVVTAVDNLFGMTLTHLLILREMVDCIVEVLKPLTLDQRRAHLGVKTLKALTLDQRRAHLGVKLNWRYQVNCFELALGKFIIYRNKVRSELLKVLQLLVNEYSITSPASIIQHQLSFEAQTSAVAVSIPTSVPSCRLVNVRALILDICITLHNCSEHDHC